MYIVNKLVAIITMLSSCATAIAMSALFTTYVAIAPDKATRRASENCFKLIGDRSAWRKRPTGARSSLRIGTRISSSSASARSQNQAWAGRQVVSESVDLKTANPKCVVEVFQDDTDYVHGRRLVLSVKDEQTALDWCW